MTLTRIERLKSAMNNAGLPALALNPGPTLTYLTGLNFHLMERPTLLLVSMEKMALVLPRLEMDKLKGTDLPVACFPFDDNPALWGKAVREACGSIHLDGLKVGIEPTRLRALEMAYLQEAAPWAVFIPAAQVLAELRMCKDADEIALMRRAVDIAEKGFLEMLPLLKTGMTEREAAAELTIQMLRAGADAEAPFAPTIGSGPNSANPHYGAGERRLQAGDLVVVDWGAYYRGYCSDLTRTLAVGEVEAEFQTIARVTADANAAGRAAGKPGVEAGMVDRAARQVIDAAGYGEYFTHRTGHGLGMEGHEEPYMFTENSLLLKPGMSYTVEPGIYFSGRGGVRIEDDVVVTETGAESLSSLPRELYMVGG